MIDQPTPPFRTGDVAYTMPSPGGYASAAAVPTDPAFAGTDKAYAIPSLGGEFQPGSGTAAPTNSPISKGADADGGAADIGAAVRIGAPPAPSPPAVVPLAVAVSGFDLTFTGTADVAKDVTVTYQVNGDGIPRNVIGNVPIGSSAGATAALVAARLNGVVHLTASTTSNQVHVATKAPNVLNVLSCVVAAGAMEDPGGGTHGSPPPPPPPPDDDDDDDDDDGIPGGDEGDETEGEGEPDPDDHSGDPDPQPRRGILKRKARKAK